MANLRSFGLIGFPLGHSFSKQYYDAKIEREKIEGIHYELFPLEDVCDFFEFLKTQPSLCGVNVTIPHKVSVLPYLDWISADAQQIGAVNCIQISREEDSDPTSRSSYFLKGYNTDYIGFVESLKPLLSTGKLHAEKPLKALLLGAGGAGKAVQFGLNSIGIPFTIVSRKPPGDNSYDAPNLTFQDLTAEIIQDHELIINATPLGTFPAEDECPDIPYQALGTEHVLYDLVYNPETTLFMKKGKLQGATVKNGFEMLEIQAEKNWQIWTEAL